MLGDHYTFSNGVDLLGLFGVGLLNDKKPKVLPLIGRAGKWPEQLFEAVKNIEP
jgi:hypothetical protein